MSQENDGDLLVASRIDGHRLSEFIYGPVTGMVAAAGIIRGFVLNFVTNCVKTDSPGGSLTTLAQ